MPVSIVVPVAIVMTASPAKRCASTTPADSGAFANNVRFPLSVVMFALMRMLRPASSVSEPPLPEELFTTMGLLTVISLLACRMTLVPLASVSVIRLDAIVMSVLDARAYVN